ncbi:GntR family transcriptional regulator [Oceaniglobus indicus]|uniref:GntR family transcriptional regulator n=1 Tax=Oceaniglobus indicus TaxID=2047749 RepID=UPI000C174DA6|nr:GntR family transcriptional regulator [Oceaniglobus indicus]
MATTRSSDAPPVPGKLAAYERFQAALLSGALQPGQFVSQRTLMQMLDLSIGALRELLPRLETEGLLRVMPQRGIQITVVDLAMIRDAFGLRMALEREAVIVCVDRLADDILHHQRRLHLDRLAVQTATDGFLDECQQIDTAFHQLLIDTTGNALLIRANAVNAIRIRLINRDRIRLSAETLEQAFRDHLAVIDALLARDRGTAVAAMETHIRRSHSNAMQG